jgi:hypothetical protein
VPRLGGGDRDLADRRRFPGRQLGDHLEALPREELSGARCRQQADVAGDPPQRGQVGVVVVQV